MITTALVSSKSPPAVFNISVFCACFEVNPDLEYNFCQVSSSVAEFCLCQSTKKKKYAFCRFSGGKIFYSFFHTSLTAWQRKLSLSV